MQPSPTQVLCGVGDGSKQLCVNLSRRLWWEDSHHWNEGHQTRTITDISPGRRRRELLLPLLLVLLPHGPAPHQYGAQQVLPC